MSVTDTSLAAYETANVSASQAAVMNALRYASLTDQEIAEDLGWTINRVTPRRGELVKLGLVMYAARIPGPSGRMTSLWARTV
jgi:DNA-binding MarR family transcriptional regulator